MPTVEIRSEAWREYDFRGRQSYRINWPVQLKFRKESPVHTVIDDKGVAHHVPAPGEQGCVLRVMSAEVAKNGAGQAAPPAGTK